MTTTVMRTSHSRVAGRCLEIRQQLRDFSAERLGPTARGEVQGHLLTCQACSEVFGELLMEEVESGAIPLLTPPQVPPIEWYDAYMRAGGGRFGTFWKSVRDALDQADTGMREWARARRSEIERALEALAGPAPLAVRTRGAVRVRGAVRTRGAAPPPSERSAEMTADVISPAGEATGKMVRFRIDEPARITPNGRFHLLLSTDDTAHDGRVVICTLTLPRNAAVSFTGIVTHPEGGTSREVRIDESGVPGRARTIPPERMSLAVLAA